jgi:very-short-patch-repair endonuclease
MTKEERHLWYDFLRNLPVPFHRQKVIGSYIVDFYCASANLVIELDGSQHYEEQGIQYDLNRDEFLRRRGLTVKRYSNSDINQRFESVCRDIYNFIQKWLPPPGEAVSGRLEKTPDD